jgi:hypothetical protein
VTRLKLVLLLLFTVLHNLCCLQLLEPQYEDTIGPIRDITQQPFWMPSQSLQLKMITHAHTLIEVLNQV